LHKDVKLSVANAVSQDRSERFLTLNGFLFSLCDFCTLLLLLGMVILIFEIHNLKGVFGCKIHFAYKCVFAVCGHNLHKVKKIHSLSMDCPV